jgi:hypothetical protein
MFEFQDIKTGEVFILPTPDNKKCKIDSLPKKGDDDYSEKLDVEWFKFHELDRNKKQNKFVTFLKHLRILKKKQ